MILALMDGVFYQASQCGQRVVVLSTFLIFDALIFSEANPSHLRNLCSLFLCFEVVFGLKINLAKSELVPVGNVINVESLVFWAVGYLPRL
jgi:hypothetical protein